jgi:hypothetical protein
VKLNLKRVLIDRACMKKLPFVRLSTLYVSKFIQKFHRKHEAIPNANMLGKRKRDHAAVPRQSLHEVGVEEVTSTSNALDLFKQYFEAKFEPLVEEPAFQQASSADEDGFAEEGQSETSDWSGFAENDTRVDEVQVIEHAVVSEATAESGASEGKYFMVRSGMYIGSPMAYLQTHRAQSPLQLVRPSQPGK